MTNSQQTLSPTGRLSQSEPEMQYFPGTPQARALSRTLAAAREAQAKEGPSFVSMDISELELRTVAHYVRNGYIKVVRPAR